MLKSCICIVCKNLRLSGLDNRRCYAKTQNEDCKSCKPRRPSRLCFVGSRISTASFREKLANSFMTYHAIDFGRYPILQYYAVIFSLRRKITFSCLWNFILRLNGREMKVKKIWFIFTTNKFVMYATSSCLEETWRKAGWRKIVETLFGMKSWFHAASSNNWEMLFTCYLVSIKRESGTQQAHLSKGINFGRPRAQISRAKF